MKKKKKKNRTTKFGDLCDDVLFLILDRLSPEDLLNFGATASRYQKLVQDNDLWNKFLIDEFKVSAGAIKGAAKKVVLKGRLEDKRRLIDLYRQRQYIIGSKRNYIINGLVVGGITPLVFGMKAGNALGKILGSVPGFATVLDYTDMWIDRASSLMLSGSVSTVTYYYPRGEFTGGCVGGVMGAIISVPILPLSLLLGGIKGLYDYRQDTQHAKAILDSKIAQLESKLSVFSTPPVTPAKRLRAVVAQSSVGTSANARFFTPVEDESGDVKVSAKRRKHKPNFFNRKSAPHSHPLSQPRPQRRCG